MYYTCCTCSLEYSCFYQLHLFIIHIYYKTTHTSQVCSSLAPQSDKKRNVLAKLFISSSAAAPCKQPLAFDSMAESCNCESQKKKKSVVGQSLKVLSFWEKNLAMCLRKVKYSPSKDGCLTSLIFKKTMQPHLPSYYKFICVPERPVSIYV